MSGNKTHLVSQLRGRADTVENLVRLGHQSEKAMNSSLNVIRHNIFPKNTIPGQPADKTRTSVLRQRCKGNPPPCSCQHYKQLPKPSPRGPKPKGLPGNGSMSIMKSKKPVGPMSQRVQET